MSPFAFDNAIVRLPGRSVVDGLRDHDGPSPNYGGIVAEHAAYRDALRTAGVTVHELDPLEDFPDAIFVEDPALVFGDTAIVLNPGAPTRQREREYLRPALSDQFASLLELPNGHVDGGDVLVTLDRVLIGLSSRTDAEGAAALIEILAGLSLKGEAVTPPGGVLHLKTQATLLDEETVLVTSAADASELFSGFRRIVVATGEEAGANALRINDRLLVAAQHARTVERLDAAGYNLLPLDTSEIQKIDAGLTCMSLRWRAGRPVA